MGSVTRRSAPVAPPQIHRRLFVMPSDRGQSGADEDGRVGDLKRHEADNLRRRAQTDRQCQRGHHEQQSHRQKHLGHHKGDEHQRVGARRQSSAPPVDADREQNAERNRDQRRDDPQLQRLKQRGVQCGVVPHRFRRIAPVPPEREPSHRVRDRPSLNENITAISTGNSDHTR